MAPNLDTSAESRTVEGIAVDVAVRLGLLALFAYWSLAVIAPFVTIVVWAAILAIAMYPVYEWLTRRLGGRGSLASLIIVVLGLLIVLGPAAALALSLSHSAQTLVEGLGTGTIRIPTPPESIRNWPLVGDNLYETWRLATTNFEQMITDHRELVLSTGGTVLGRVVGVAGSLVGIAVSVIISGFLFTNAAILAEGANMIAKRIVADQGEVFIDLARSAIRNVARGVIGIAILQTLLAGIGLLFIGIPGAGLITFGVLILSVVQIGPGLIMLPVVIWVWTTLDIVTAAAFTAYIIPVALLDNVLKPIVMARGLRTPMLVILIGVLGGALSHGLIGLFLGPIVLAVFYELLKSWVMIKKSEAQSTA